MPGKQLVNIFSCMLCLAEMELVFPKPALLVLCFVLVVRKVLRATA